MKLPIRAVLIVFCSLSVLQLNAQNTMNSTRQLLHESRKADSTFRELLSSIERKYHVAKRYLNKKEESTNFKVHVINQSNLSPINVKRNALKLIEQLNSDFGIAGRALVNEKGYEELLDTVGFSFRLSDLTFEAEALWNSWSDWKIDISTPSEAIRIWIVDTPKDIGSYAISGVINSSNEGIVMDVEHFQYSVSDTSRIGITQLMGQYFGLDLLYDESGNCQDDYVFDTPRHRHICSGCIPNTITSSCDNRNYMCGNLMSLAPNSCKSFFTKDQVRRIHFFVNESNTLQNKIQK